MSCSIDHSRGSILMEFVLVLPIYIFLLGALYLLGDMGLNAVRISIGDRSLAMDAGDREGLSSRPFDLWQMREEASKTSFEHRTYRAEESFKGSWSWQTAGKTWFAYKLPSYGGGLVSYPYLKYGGTTSDGGVLGTLVGGGTVLFNAKDASLGSRVRKYNYYTLKRTDLARDPTAYRNWDSQGDTSESWLVDSAGGGQYWYKKICEEEYADSKGDKLDASTSQSTDELPDPPSGRKEYKRLDLLVTWSQ